MRHLTYESISRFFFSEVWMRSASLDSMVRMRLSSVTTFWNGGGALKYRPGFADDLAHLAQREHQGVVALADHEDA